MCIILSIALDHHGLARAGLYRAILESFVPAASALRDPAGELDRALVGLRQAGQTDELPKALLTASLFAWLRERSAQTLPPASATDAVPDSLQHSAEEYLAEAELIAQRGPMPLYLADVQLHRARLFANRDALARSRDLIARHAYGRRQELEDAKPTD